MQGTSSFQLSRLMLDQTTVGYFQDDSATDVLWGLSRWSGHCWGSQALQLGQTVDNFPPTPWERAWHLLTLREQALGEEASRSAPAWLLQILFLECVVSSAMGSYFYILADNQEQGQQPMLFAGLLNSPRPTTRRKISLAWHWLRLLLDNLWLLKLLCEVTSTIYTYIDIYAYMHIL